MPTEKSPIPAETNKPGKVRSARWGHNNSPEFKPRPTVSEGFRFERYLNDFGIWTEKGIVTVRFLTENIVNIFLPVETGEQVSRVIEPLAEKELDLEVIFRNDCMLQIKSTALTVEVWNPYRITFKDPAGNILNDDYKDQGAFLEKPIGVYKQLFSEEHFYGFGEKTGFLDKAGEELVMWNSDIPEAHVPSMKALYKSIPFFIGLREGVAYGIFFDNTYKTYFDMGKSSREYYSFTAEGGNIDYYFIYGPAIKDVLKGYTTLTGRMNLPPLWALGYQQSRWGYYPEIKVMEIADTLREKDIPCDVLYLDIDYMDGYRVFTWDRDRFPNPEEMLKQLRAKGFKVVPIVDPGVKKDKDYRIYQELLENHYYVTDSEGLPFVGRVWPGECVFPDFTDAPVREWWGAQHKVLMDAGVAGIWNDMNEPAVFTDAPRNPDQPRNPDEHKTMPLSNRHKNDGRPATHAEMHNLYGYMMSRATYEGLRKLSDRRPFIVSRACYAGMQKYAALWTGDNQSFWDHLGLALPMCMNLGLSGVPFIGTDVGGFGSDCTGELLSRWVQVGCFTPFFRNHSAWDTRRQEPWAFDEETEAINRKYIKLRYKLLPYLYNVFREASHTGLPIMRPLVLEYPADPEVYRIYDQFMCGESMLVAPVITPATEYRHVYLPAGEWEDYWTGERYTGKQHLLVHAPLDTLPLFVKAGSIIPTYEPMSYVGEKAKCQVTFQIYEGTGTYEYYEDDGDTFAYEKGEYNLTRFTLTKDHKQGGTGEIILQIEPEVRGYAHGSSTYILQYHGLAECELAEGEKSQSGVSKREASSIKRVMVNAREVPISISEGKLTLEVSAAERQEVRILK